MVFLFGIQFNTQGYDLKITICIWSFSLAFGSIHKDRIGKLLFAYGLSLWHSLPYTSIWLAKLLFAYGLSLWHSLPYTRIWLENYYLHMVFLFGFHFHTQGCDWKLLFAYCLSKENVSLIIMVYNNTEIMVHLHDWDTDSIEHYHWSLTREIH